MSHTAIRLSADDPGAVLETVLDAHRRVLFTGPAGIGKSTLVDTLVERLEQEGRACRCLSADPGSPLFGVPGALSLGRRVDGDWSIEAMEALCTLDAGRFRLPLVAAVTRLAQQGPDLLLVDGPGVVRGIGGAELLPALVQAADIDAVVVLTRAGRALGLEAELAALGVETYTVTASDAAQRPGKNARARARTAQWEAYLSDAAEYRLPLASLHLLGTPPPTDVAAAWVGRQVALLDDGLTRSMGEVLAVEGNAYRLRLAQPPGEATSLLTRDAMRTLEGQLATATPYVTEALEYLPPPDIAPPPGNAPADTGPRVVGRVGMLGVSLINGVFGDPLLHARLRHQARSLLFDLGEGARLSARIAHQVSDVFISHTHIDHIAGFLWLLRSRIGEYPVCRMFGPPGLADNIEGLTRGILWDRIEDRGPQFEVTELHGDTLKRFRVQAGRKGCERLGEEACEDGVVLRESGFSVRAVALDHGTTDVLAYAFEPARQINVRKDRLAERGLAPGPWLGELKDRIHADDLAARLRLPDGTVATVRELADELVLVSAGKKLVYATDFGDTTQNRERLIALAHGAHTLFCESTFLEADIAQARRTAHLTTRACGEIATAARVARLVPFHFSRRYEADVSRVYEEIGEYCASLVVPS
jgi:ribonuclease BN (tRNA processing enzyme)